MGIIVSAVAWTFLWGPAGLVMSTPLTVVLVVMGEYVGAFSIFSRLLGDKPVMEPHFQLYQRLLAGACHIDQPIGIVAARVRH